MVAREGGSLAGGSIARLVAGNGNPRIELNDRSQVLFWANLTDGRDGLFLTSPIPEPALVWTFLAGVALIGMRVARGHVPQQHDVGHAVHLKPDPLRG